MKPLVLNIDSDGVVYQFSKTIRKAAERRFGVDLSDPSQTWELWHDIGISKTQFYKFFHEQIMAGVFVEGDEVPGATEAVQYLIDQGHRVRIVTSKIFPNNPASNYIAKTDTIAWYYNQGLVNDIEFVFTGNGHAKQGYPADVVVDDKPTLEWSQDYPTLNLLFDQPWNRQVSNEELMDSDVVRAYGWNDVLRKIEGHVIVV